MRIAWVSYGFEEYSGLHVNAMCEEHDVLMVMPRAEADETQHEIDPRVQEVRFDKPRLRQPIKQVASVRELVAKIDSFKPDVVHFQQGHMWFNAALKKLKRYPLVITIHDPRHHAGDTVSKKTPQWLMDYGFRKADHVIVHGKALADQVRDLFGFSQDRIHVIPHVAMGASATTQLSGSPLPQILGKRSLRSRVERGEPENCVLIEEPGTVLFFGRIYQYKGLHTLIAAEPLISEQVSDFKIVIGGAGDDFDQYTSAMKNPDRFEVHNRWISDDERVGFFDRASMVVLPYNEATQSGVVPVAFNYAKPVVATKVGALTECVDHERTGLLVPPSDPQALADAIIRLLNNPHEAAAMGLAGKQMLDRDWSPTVVARQTADVYRQAIASHRAGLHDRSKPLNLQEVTS